MRFVFFVHSILSDWNHGNAHFLRGIVGELQQRGNETVIYEPANGWSRQNLVRDHGEAAIDGVRARFPHVRSRQYERQSLDPHEVLEGADVVLVHEWTEPWLVQALGRHRAAGGQYILLFHDTHHRAVTAPHELESLDLAGFDGALCFGEVIRQLYLERGWIGQAWTWHEAADTSLFRPLPEVHKEDDLVWIGNWGDEERSAELREFLIKPVRTLRLAALVHGVRYPDAALVEIAGAGARYGGWLPNHRVPEAFSRCRATVHIPRGPYAEALPGIPTIRVFEALACGIPLVSAPWSDSEALFTPGRDYLVAADGEQMTSHLRAVLNDRDLAGELAANGLSTIQARHTCRHRVDELLAICARIPSGV